MAKATKSKSKGRKPIMAKAKAKAPAKKSVAAKPAKAVSKVKKVVSKAKAKAPKAKVTKAKASRALHDIKVKRLTKERSNAVGMSLKNVGSNSRDYPFSGKFTVRLPKSLHQALVERSKKEGVSLNLFVTNALSRTVASGASAKKK